MPTDPVPASPEPSPAGPRRPSHWLLSREFWLFVVMPLAFIATLILIDRFMAGSP